jgi:hypothetical protein
MKKSFVIPIIITAFIFITAFELLNKDQGKNKASIVLNDGETVQLDSIFSKFSENSIIENLEKTNLTSAIIRSFDSDSNNINDLKLYVGDIFEREYIDYWTINPPSRLGDPTYVFHLESGGFDWRKIYGFGDYYHLLFSNKTTRTLLFKKGLDLVESMCKIYPSDFKKRILIELESLLKFTNNIKFISYNDDLEFENYWQGFIVRRHFTDKVPIIEIQNSIIEAINKLKVSSSTNSYTALYEININSQIIIFYSGEGTYVTTFTGEKKYSFKIDDSIKSIRYLRDLSGDYYQITTTNDSGEKRYLFSKSLEQIL